MSKRLKQSHQKIIPIRNFSPLVQQKKDRHTRVLIHDLSMKALLEDKEREINRLQDESRNLREQVRKKNEALQDSIDLWEDGLRDGEWPGYDAVRRFLSRQKGAKNYRGE